MLGWGASPSDRRCGSSDVSGCIITMCCMDAAPGMDAGWRSAMTMSMEGLLLGAVSKAAAGWPTTTADADIAIGRVNGADAAIAALVPRVRGLLGRQASAFSRARPKRVICGKGHTRMGSSCAVHDAPVSAVHASPGQAHAHGRDRAKANVRSAAG